MAKIERQKEAQRLNFGGMNIVYPPDTMPPSKYPYALNVRAYQGNAVGPRLPQSAPAVSVTGIVHSLQRLNDNNVSPGYGVWVSGSGTVLNVGATQVATGFSGNRLGMASYRPAASPAPWMYVADTAQALKTNAEGLGTYNTGIEEPQTIPTVTTGPSGSGPTYPVFYFFKWRSSFTGAVSNPSPPMLAGFTPTSGHVPNVVIPIPGSIDPQVDTADVYRQDVGLINPTFVTAVPLSVASFNDEFTDEDLAANPLMQYDDFQPYPSIDLPHNSVVNVAGSPPGPWTITWVSGAKFNTRWLPGTIINTQVAGSWSLYVRPTSATSMQAINNPVDFTGSSIFISIPEPILAAQRLPTLWGPTDNTGFFFSVGDPLRPGTLYFTKGGNPDSAPQTNQIEVTSPSEPLINGAIVNGIGVVLSTERGWLIYPNFANAVATVVGLQGSPFQCYETIQGYGLYTKEGICTDGGANLFFWSKEGIRVSQGGLGSQSLTDDDLFPLFPHEGQLAQPYTIGSYTVNPPDYTNPNSFALRWAEGYLYADYQDTLGNYWTLVFDTVNKAWSVDLYQFPAVIHADTQGQSIGTATGDIGGKIRTLSPAGIEVDNAILATPSFDAGDLRATKRFADLYIEAAVEAGDPISLDLWLNRYNTHQNASLSTTSLPSTLGVRTGVVVELLAGLGVYTTDIALAFTIPLNPVPSGLLYAWQPTLVPQPETIGERATDWDDAGNPGAKYIQGCTIEADSGNVAKHFAIQSSDDLSLNTPVEAPFAWNGQSTKAFSFNPPFTSHNMRIVPQDTVPWRLWGVKYLFQPHPELVDDWNMDFDNAGTPGAKFIQGCVIEADTQNVPKIIAVQNGDDLSIHTAIESPGTFDGHSLKAFSFQTPFVAHNMRIIPQDAVPMRFWSVKWVFVPFPEIADNWQTELISHGLKGWQHIKEINLPYLSNAALTLTLTPDPQSYPIATIPVPSSGGLQTKLLLIAPPNKFKLMGYGLTGTGGNASFRVWKEDMEVKVGPWGRTDAYQIIRPFGGESREGATV
jgi:hypothetical protein